MTASTEIVFAGMTHQRLTEVFGLVKPAENWKDPISAAVATAVATPAEIEAAVAFFTGGIPEITEVDGVYWVEAPGYYACIGA